MDMRVRENYKTMFKRYAEKTHSSKKLCLLYSRPPDGKASKQRADTLKRRRYSYQHQMGSGHRIIIFCINRCPVNHIYQSREYPTTDGHQRDLHASALPRIHDQSTYVHRPCRAFKSSQDLGRYCVQCARGAVRKWSSASIISKP